MMLDFWPRQVVVGHQCHCNQKNVPNMKHGGLTHEKLSGQLNHFQRTGSPVIFYPNCSPSK